jgi:DNA-directed RNA polymerase subunit beta'
VHFISKDISLKMSESGETVTAGQEVVKDVFAHMEGIVEIVADNDIIHEVIVRPGELFNINDPSDVKVPEGQIVEPGTEIIEGQKFKDRKIVNVLEREDGTIQVLVRPIEEYWIEPKDTKFKHKATDDKISLRSVTQLLFRDREKVRNLQGAQLTRTSLVLQMQGQLMGLKGIVEIGEEEMNIVVQENILLRREHDLNVTLLSVPKHHESMRVSEIMNDKDSQDITCSQRADTESITVFNQAASSQSSQGADTVVSSGVEREVNERERFILLFC